MSKNTVTTWTCDGCEVSMTSSSTYPPRQNWLTATFHRQVAEHTQEVHSLVLCVGCQERMLDALKEPA